MKLYRLRKKKINGTDKQCGLSLCVFDCKFYTMVMVCTIRGATCGGGHTYSSEAPDVMHIFLWEFILLVLYFFWEASCFPYLQFLHVIYFVLFVLLCLWIVIFHVFKFRPCFSIFMYLNCPC